MFCITCGKKLLQKKINKFDAKTGKSLSIHVCPSNECGHDGVDHSAFIKKNSFIDDLLGKYRYCLFCKREV